MLSPPDDLAEDVLASTLALSWRVSVASMTYRPVGFGSHHWEVVDADGGRWFVTVDELAAKRRSWRDSLDTAYDRLRASLGAAIDLAAHGHEFVVAPVSTSDGEPLARAAGRFGVALYPYVDGRSFTWGEFSTPEHQRAVLDIVVALHTTPPGAGVRALPDDFAIPHLDELSLAMREAVTSVADTGPYARPTATLLARNAASVRRLLDRYDGLVAASGARQSRTVPTHGEPHPGNTMLTAGGWRLIDWDTALLAPPERDLWSLDPGDGSVLDAYADATGVTPRPSMLELYRLRWDIADIAVCVSRFRRRHTGNADDNESWDILRALIRQHAARNGPVPAGPVPAGPIPAGPIPAGPVPAGPIPAGPVPDGPVPAGSVLDGSVLDGSVLDGSVLDGSAEGDGVEDGVGGCGAEGSVGARAERVVDGRERDTQRDEHRDPEDLGITEPGVP